MAEYMISEELESIAKKVISEHEELKHLDNTNCRIAYQFSDEAKKNSGKKVYADTEKVKDKYKEFMHYDFVITFYEENTRDITEESMEKLMYHELRHVGFEPLKMQYYIIPHDVEDFKDIIDKWGISWIR